MGFQKEIQSFSSGQYLHSIPRKRNLDFLDFLTVQLCFPTNCLILQLLLVKTESLTNSTVGIFPISQLVNELQAKDEFLFLAVYRNRLF